MSAAKRRKSAPAVAAETSPRPQTRSCTSASRTAAEAASEGAAVAALSFLDAASFRDEFVAPLYRLGPPSSGSRASPIVEKDGAALSSDPVAEALGFTSPFVAMNMADRKGVWQSTPPLIKELGEDPKKSLRRVVQLPDEARDVAVPAGLKNLGATCYLNSLLQYLFFNADFRRGLMAASSGSAVVRALQEVFVLLAKGHSAVVDTTAFVSAAGLEAGEQEDATEFSTLLLDWLQRELRGGDKAGSEEAGGDFVAELFEGKVSQILSCATSHSERREPFFELRARLSPSSGGTANASQAAATKSEAFNATAPLPPATVVGAAAPAEQPESAPAATAAVSKNRPAGPAGKRPSGGKKKAAAAPVVHLEQLLADTAFPDETLDGANQYHCPTCDRKVDARKSLRLAEAPPYLHVTVERYHYDLQKGEREKLLNPVSFPRRLQLNVYPGLDKEADTDGETVAYDCIGFLEHISDSAQSGHYTATLFQASSAADAAESSAEPASEAVPEAVAAVGSDEPPAKRARQDESEPRAGVWWTLDDTEVCPVKWPQPKAPPECAAAADAQVAPPATPGPRRAPERIESSSAYLILYRRGDRSPSEDLKVSDCLADIADGANDKLARLQAEFGRRSEAVSSFVAERRKAAAALANALREARGAGGQQGDPGQRGQGLSVVPTTWLQAFLRGEDRSISELLEEDPELLPPVLYGRSLVRAPCGQGLVLDPLAVWTGEVRLVPTAALESVCGLGGLDPSMFLAASCCSADRLLCERFWSLMQIHMQEWRQIGRVLQEGKVTIAEARQLQAAGRGSEAVWVSLRVQKLWQKAFGVGGSAGGAKAQPPQVAALRAFLSEAHAARWASAEEPSETADTAEGSTEPAGAKTAEQTQQPTRSAANRQCEVSLTAGLLGPSGLVCRPKSGVLFKRSEVQELLKVAGSKEEAYRELWPDARCVPCIRTGVPGGGLLGFGDTEPECCGDGAGAAASPPGKSKRKLVVKRCYASGARRKAGTVSIPEGDGPWTGEKLRRLVSDQLKFPVAKLKVVLPSPDGPSTEAELKDGETLGDGVDQLLVEKDESPQPSAEAVAFQGSIFRAPAVAPAAA